MTEINLEEYGKNFDRLVYGLNEWLKNAEDPKKMKPRYFKAFLRGMESVLNLYGKIEPFEFISSNPIYSNKDLYPEQKDAISLASDWRRVSKNLCKIIRGEEPNKIYFTEAEEISIQDARIGKIMAEDLYNSYRDMFISHEIRKNFTPNS